MNTTKIDELIAIKKKSDASVKTKQSFQEEWLQLARTQGLTDDVIKYLYEGFSFTRATPLVNYIRENEAAFTNMDNFFRNHDYAEKNKSITSKLLLNMLVLLLKTPPEKHEIIKYAIKKLPFYGKDEKGGLVDNKTLKKYFIQELLDDLSFPKIEFYDMEPYFKSFYVRIMKNFESIDNEKETTESEKEIINNVRKWLSTLYKEDNLTIANDSVEKITDTSEKKKETIIPDSEKGQMKKNMAPEECIGNILSSANDLRKIIQRLCNDIRDYKDEKTRLQNELAEESSLYLREREERQNIAFQLSQANERIAQLSDVVKNQEKQIISKDTEIKSREKLSEILLRQKDDQIVIVMNRISGDLEIEYKDFLSAVSCPMTVDLGENMREQLKSVFSLLKKHGIRLE
jgi:hypothetical protein